MGGGGSESQSTSQASSISREALYTPSVDAINKSMQVLKDIYQQGQNRLQPFNTQALQATNDMMFWQGLRGVDPLTQQTDALTNAIRDLKAPGGYTQQVLIPETKWYDTKPGEQPRYNPEKSHAQSYFNISAGTEDALRNTKSLSDILTGLNENLSLLTNTDDPTKRQELYDKTMQSFDLFDKSASDILNANAAAMNGRGIVTANKVMLGGGPQETGTASLDWSNTWGLTGTPNNQSVTSFEYADPTTGQIHKISGDLLKQGSFTSTPGTGGGSDPEAFLKQMQNISDIKSKIMGTYSQAGYGAPTADAVMTRLANTPGYQTQLRQGLEGVQNLDISRGLFGSGRAAREITRYGQEYAQNALTNQFNRSAAIAGMTIPTVSQGSSQTVAQAAPLAASTQLAGSSWNMSPWTQQSQSTSQSTSKTTEGMGGFGGILGSLMGGIF